MNRIEHPRGLSPEEREEWYILCNRLLELYRSMPDGYTKRKMIAGGDDEEEGSLIILIRGNQEDAEKIKQFIEKM